jgi:RNA methyltransferase, TrmH family
VGRAGVCDSLSRMATHKKRPPPHRSRHPTAPPAPQASRSEIVYGLRAGLAFLDQHPTEVLRVGHAASVTREVEAALREARMPREMGQVLSERELDRIADGPHHEGLVLETKPRRWSTPNELADHLVEKRGVAVALDRVRNPYNIGAILRTAAFFGVDAALLGPLAPHPALEPQAVRVAEGGVEHLLLSRTTDLADTLSRLKMRGVKVYGADGAGEVDALRFVFPRPCVLVMGNEREGMKERVRALCDAIVSIRGAGKVESLNVAVAASVLVSRLV